MVPLLKYGLLIVCFLYTVKEEIGTTILFFGCRHRAEDYLYQEELEAYHKEGVLSSLHVAFSRDQEEKEYVQHIMLRNGGTIFQLLENQAYFYVCG